jgi:outer membrane protein OmpA-like peptidoglycan-associated protein
MRRIGHSLTGAHDMTKSRSLVSALAAAALLSTSACVTDPNTGHKRVSHAAIDAGIGTVAGLLVGGLIGGAGGRILGAGIGGIAGAVIGSSKDEETRKLKEQTAGTGVNVTNTDNGNSILVNLPESVTFDAGSYNLKPEARTVLDRISDSLRQYPNSLVDVYGHSDNREAGMNGQPLSENRARTIANYLASHGVSEARIRSQGFGATMPIASNDTAEGRAQNRRVEIKIVPISQEQVQSAKSSQP